jgi:hypothetical protein
MTHDIVAFPTTRKATWSTPRLTEIALWPAPTGSPRKGWNKERHQRQLRFLWRLRLGPDVSAIEIDWAIHVATNERPFDAPPWMIKMTLAEYDALAERLNRHPDLIRPVDANGKVIDRDKIKQHLRGYHRLKQTEKQSQRRAAKRQQDSRKPQPQTRAEAILQVLPVPTHSTRERRFDLDYIWQRVRWFNCFHINSKPLTKCSGIRAITREIRRPDLADEIDIRKTKNKFGGPILKIRRREVSRAKTGLSETHRK